MVEKLLKTLAVTLHFGIDWQKFSCAYPCNVVFIEALLLAQILQEFYNRGVDQSHDQLEGSIPAFNVVIGLLFTISRFFELIPKSDWKQWFTSFSKTTRTSKPSFFEVFQIKFDLWKTFRCRTYLIEAHNYVFGRNYGQWYARLYRSSNFDLLTVYFFQYKVLYFAPVGLGEVEEATCKNSRNTNIFWNEIKCGLKI